MARAKGIGVGGRGKDWNGDCDGAVDVKRI